MRLRFAVFAVCFLSLAVSCDAETMPYSEAGKVKLDDGKVAQPEVDNFSAPLLDTKLLEKAVFVAVAPTPLLLAALPQAQPPLGSPTPEPSSLLLLATGALGMVEAHRRRRKGRA